MRIVHLDQRSSEWLELRRSKIGASDCAAILGKSRYKSPRMLWKQKMEGTSTPMNPAMQKGIDLEPEARLYFEQKFGASFPSSVALHDEYSWMMASFDGFNAERDAVLEIKVVGKKTFEEVEKGIIPVEYEWQVQHQMCVSGAGMALLAFYYKTEDELKAIEVGVGRDEAMIAELVEKEGAFYHINMLGYIEPEASDMDAIERKDASWYALALKYRGVKERREALEEEEKSLKEMLIELAGGESCQGYGVRATRYQSEGRVDYKKVPQLEDVDLTPYRSAASFHWRITSLP